MNKFLTSSTLMSLVTAAALSNNQNLQASSEYTLGIFLIIEGLFLLFAGHKHFRSTLALSVGMFVAFFVYGIMVQMEISSTTSWGPNRQNIYLGVILSVAFLSACLAYCAYGIGIYLIGAYGGLVTGLTILSFIPSTAFGPYSYIIRIILIIVFIIIGIVIIKLFVERTVIIVITSFGGSLNIILGIDAFAKLGLLASMNSYYEKPSLYTYNLSGAIVGMLILEDVLAIIGMYYQFKYSK